MGNRAVITTRENFENNGIGIYVHWNGGRDSVEAFLEYCKRRQFRSTKEDESYAFARLTQVIANYFGGGLSVGVNTCDHLDLNNYDNGVYIIDGWEIVGREYFGEDCEEQREYDLEEMIASIDKCQPEGSRLENI